MTIDWGREWQRRARRAGFETVLRPYELRHIEALRLEAVQIKWAMGEYMKGAGFLGILDFCEWVGQMQQASTLPSPVMAAALDSNSDRARELADELEVLQAAWFPTEETQTRIGEIEQTLKALL